MRLRQLALLSFGFVSVRAGGAALGLLAQLLLARLLPVDAVGRYFLAVSLAGILGLLLTGGYAAIATTFLPRYQALMSERLRRGFLAAARDSTAARIAVALPIAALVMALAPLQEDARYAIAIGALAAPALCLIRMNNAIAVGLGRFQLSFVPDHFVRPALLLVSIVSLYALFGSLSLPGVLYAYLATALVVGGAQSIVLGRNSFVWPNKLKLTRTRRAAWRSRAAAYLIVTAATIFLADILILMGGFLLSASELAVLAIAAKVAVLVGFVTQTTQSFATPDLAKATQLGRILESRALLARATAVGLGLNVLAALGCLVAGGFILSIFGPEYVKGSLLLVALMAGQLIRAAGGMNAQLLSIHGDQKAVAGICATTMLTLFAMAALVTPRYGLVGIAGAVIVSDVLWVALLALRTRKRIGMSGDIFALLAR